MEVNLNEIKEQIAKIISDDGCDKCEHLLPFNKYPEECLELFGTDIPCRYQYKIATEILSLIQPLLAERDERIATLEAELANLRAIEAQHKELNGQLREALKGAKYAE